MGYFSEKREQKRAVENRIFLVGGKGKTFGKPEIEKSKKFQSRKRGYFCFPLFLPNVFELPFFPSKKSSRFFNRKVYEKILYWSAYQQNYQQIVENFPPNFNKTENWEN